MSKYNSYALKNMLQDEHIYIILENLGAQGIKKDSNGWRSSCPIHNSKNTTSFVYNYDKHLYYCYGDCNLDDKEGDIITLVKKVQKCDFDNAIKLICEWSKIDIKLIEDSEDWILEEFKIKLDNILNINNEKINFQGDKKEIGRAHV